MSKCLQATVHDVGKKFRCKHCKVKGENTFQIVWRGNSDIALDGVDVRLAKTLVE